MRRLAVFAALAFVLAGCNGDSSTKSTTAEAAAKKGPKPGPPQHFRSRPVLHPPDVKVRVAAHDTAPGYIFLAPKMAVAQAGPMIMDNRGQVVWFHPLKHTKGVTEFRAQHYRGRP